MIATVSPLIIFKFRKKKVKQLHHVGVNPFISLINIKNVPSSKRPGFFIFMIYDIFCFQNFHFIWLNK